MHRWSAAVVTSRNARMQVCLSVGVYVCPSQGKGGGLRGQKACKPLADGVSVIQGGYKNSEKFSVRGGLKKHT